MPVTLLQLLLLCTGGIAKNISKSILGDDLLNLTPYIDKGETDEARNLSAVDPTLFAGVHSHAAFITVNKTNKWNQFFWFFPAEGKPLESTPWIIWLQGGPGASSLFGLFHEIGPLKIIDGKATKMAITWGTNYSLLFIDNPIGAGFSYSEGEAFMSNQDDVGTGLLAFLQQFLEVFPELRKAPLFIAGESYAGKYIPAFGYYIHHHKNESRPINLKGLAIGDGWIDPPTLLHHSELGLQLGIISPEQSKKIKKYETAALKALDEGKLDKYSKNYKHGYELLLNFANMSDDNNFLRDNFSFPSDFIHFVNRKDVRSAMHTGDVPFYVLSETVYNHFSHEIYQSVKSWLEELLEFYGVMCYSGQLDVGVGYWLSVHTYRSLNWTGNLEYLLAERKPIWDYDPYSELNPIGYIKAGGNLVDVMVRVAGHMVPADQPRAAKQIIDMFIDQFKNSTEIFS